MSRLPNDATLADRKQLHAAKMAGKKYDAARRAQLPNGGATPPRTMSEYRAIHGTSRFVHGKQHARTETTSPDNVVAAVEGE